jgi:hypothetical protein
LLDWLNYLVNNHTVFTATEWSSDYTHTC